MVTDYTSYAQYQRNIAEEDGFGDSIISESLVTWLKKEEVAMKTRMKGPSDTRVLAHTNLDPLVLISKLGVTVDDKTYVDGAPLFELCNFYFAVVQ